MMIMIDVSLSRQVWQNMHFWKSGVKADFPAVRAYVKCHSTGEGRHNLNQTSPGLDACWYLRMIMHMHNCFSWWNQIRTISPGIPVFQSICFKTFEVCFTIINDQYFKGNKTWCHFIYNISIVVILWRALILPNMQFVMQ